MLETMKKILQQKHIIFHALEYIPEQQKFVFLLSWQEVWVNGCIFANDANDMEQAATIIQNLTMEAAEWEANAYDFATTQLQQKGYGDCADTTVFSDICIKQDGTILFLLAELADDDIVKSEKGVWVVGTWEAGWQTAYLQESQ